MVNNKLSKDINLSVESQSALKLERKLSIDLNSVLKYIYDNISFTSSNYLAQFLDLRDRIYNEVYSIIRSFSQQAYVLGAQYVTNKMRIKFYITHHDLDVIDTKARDYTARFFGRLEKSLEKSAVQFFKDLMNVPRYNINLSDETQIAFFAKRIEQNASYVYSSLATAIIMDSLNTATMRKTQAIMKITPKNSLYTAAARDFTNPDVIRRLETSFIENDEVADAIGADKFIWRTAEDFNVCQICNDLDGSEYQIGDPDVPSIPEDSHWNCRCRLEIE